MANERHGVVRTDNMAGTKLGSFLVSIRHDEDIDNGHLLAIDEYEDSTREVRTASVPTTGTAIGRLALCATPEVVRDVAEHDIFDFFNRAGTLIRGYRLNAHDIFSITTECLSEDSVEPARGLFACLVSGTRIRLSATEVATVIGRVIDVEIETNGNTFVVIEVGGVNG